MPGQTRPVTDERDGLLAFLAAEGRPETDFIKTWQAA